MSVEFANAYVLLLLVLVPAAGAVWLVGANRAEEAGRLLWRRAGPVGGRIRMLMLLAGAGLAIVAGAGPQWGDRAAESDREAADLFIVLDVSRSMSAEDIAPSRLEAAKTAVAETLSRMSGQRVGVVVFGGDARLRFPLTSDLGAASEVVRGLQPGVRFVQSGSSATSGLAVALESFELERPSGKLIVLITDGDDLGVAPTGTAEAIREAGVSLLVAGAGTANGGRVKVFDFGSGSFVDKLGPDGTPIVSRLNDRFLADLAMTGGGSYLGNDLSLVPGAVTGQAALLEGAEIDTRTVTFPISQFHWFATGSLALIAIGLMGQWLSVAAKRGGLVGATGLVTILAAGCATTAYNENESGRQLLSDGNVEGAIGSLYAAEAADPTDITVAQNLALALMAGERYDDAERAARRVLAGGRRDEQVLGLQLIGNAQFRAGNLAGSLDAFRRALIVDPENESIRHDYEVIFRLLGPGGGGADGPGAGVGDGTPVPGSAAPPVDDVDPGSESVPGDNGDSSGSGGGRPADIESLEDQIGDLDRQIQEILREGHQPTAEEAAKVLDLLAERSRLNSLRDVFSIGSDPLDY